MEMEWKEIATPENLVKTHEFAIDCYESFLVAKMALA